MSDLWAHAERAPVGAMWLRCVSCRRVEVIIFLGSNRSRRRSFNNTFVFYRILHRILAGESLSFDVEADKAPKRELPLFAASGVMF
jgi:hypothetical protein